MPAERRSSTFCCVGCEAVYALLHQEGLTRFYDLGGRATGAVGTVPHVPSFDWLGELEQRNTIGDTVRVTVDVQGIRCAACVWLLRALWQRADGGLDLRVTPSLGQATLVYRAGSAGARWFLETAAKLGYPMAPPSRRLSRDTGLLLRLGICAAVAMNAMILAVSLYFGLDAVDATSGDAVLRTLFGWVLLGLGTISVAVGGPVFFRAAWNGVRAGVVHMDLPISLGIALAFAGSVHGQFSGGATYFDTVAIFVALMLGGRFLQQRTLAQSRDQVLADDGAEHLRARRVRDSAIELVPILQLHPGDELILAPGDLVPTRGVLLGDAMLSLDWINGESEPRAFAAGQDVPAGAFHAGRAAVRMRVTATYADSGLASLLLQEPFDREHTRGKVRFWEQLNRYYAIGVLIAAAAGALVWALIEPARALPVATAILVVTCPCAIGIAVPLAFHLALARLRRRGVFVRTKSLLDKVRLVKKVVFDKTGTVTFGGLRARATVAPAAAVAPVLATMAAASNHPVSQAVLASLGRAPAMAALLVEELPGQGLRAMLDGVEWRLGSRGFAGLGERAAGDERRECVLTRDGELVAGFELEEDFRSGAAEELQALERAGLEVHLLSGDRADRVQTAARRLGLSPERARGGLSPQDKAAVVAALDAHDTMMVGDGLNDAPAFAAAWCAGTPAMDRPVLPARADFCFRSADAGAVLALRAVAEQHGRVVRGNLLLALTYNAVVLSLAFSDAITPLVCAISMPISSVALVLHTSLRMQRRRNV